MVTKVNSLLEKKAIHLNGQSEDSVNIINVDNLKNTVNMHKTKASSESKRVHLFAFYLMNKMYF